ncbi:MAG: class I SAM-dependent methyltransferase [Candidatus Bathyarchaeia archaeon]
MNEKLRIDFLGKCPICGRYIGPPCVTEEEAGEVVRKHSKEKHGKEANNIQLARVGLLEKHTIELHPIKTEGFILDIGGGGEGIIGKLMGRKVIAIDISSSELEEARERETDKESLKIVMDASDLKFLSESFDVATSFFALMYIENDLHQKVFNEVNRVLKENGRFLIWDVRIPERVKDARGFTIPLEIILPDEKVGTGYGVKWDKQDLEYFKGLATRTGFKVLGEWKKDEIFFLELLKHTSGATSNSG